ncbi:MAG: DUF3179 domain-containing (seleno)protein, partial [Acidimicrobiales bacterium]
PVAAGCSVDQDETDPIPASRDGVTATHTIAAAEATESATGRRPLPVGAEVVIDAYVARIAARIYEPLNPIDTEVINRVGRIDDDRVAWLIADGLRFVGRGPEFDALIEAGSRLGGLELSARTAWLALNNHLLAVDRPAPPGYAAWKRDIFIAVDPTWAPFFDDERAEIDWRLVGFGGVLADGRPFGSDDSCQCIAALDDPPAQPAPDVDWLSDGDTVIGVTVGGRSRAYPLHIMETHELVNDELGGERIALAYCTLCGSGQAYRLDPVPDDLQPAVLRTSGLLNRSNKIMFDLTSRSMIDTFTGEARTGPWREAGIVLEPITTVTSSWGTWKADHPQTTVMAGRNGAGADYPFDPLGGRDDGGPIFPTGTVDPRLFPQTDVIGVTTADGGAVAFPVVEARRRLVDDRPVELAGVSLFLDGSGLRAIDVDGNELVSHQAFWFAWSQFNPETALWAG